MSTGDDQELPPIRQVCSADGIEDVDFGVVDAELIHASPAATDGLHPPIGPIPRFAGPIQLEDGEHEILRGGFALTSMLAVMLTSLAIPVGFIGILVCAAVAMYCASLTLLNVMIVVCVSWFFLTLMIPWCLSGRYCLTTHRLLWKPRFGRGYAMPVEWLRACQVSVGAYSGTLRIRGPVRLSLRMIRGLEQLWGAVFLLQCIDPAQLRHQGEPLSDVVVCPGMTFSGSWNVAAQRGALVMRPHYVALLPSEPQATLVSTWGAVGGVLLGVSSLKCILPFEALLQRVAGAPAVVFDEFVADSVRAFGGVLWESEDAEVQRLHFVHKPEHPSIRFVSGGVVLVAYPDDEQIATIDQLAQDWQNRGAPVTEAEGPNFYRWASVLLVFGLVLSLVCGWIVYAGIGGDLAKNSPMGALISLIGMVAFALLLAGSVIMYRAFMGKSLQRP